MDDDKNPNDPNTNPPPPDEENPEGEQSRHRPISHLDELMGAKDKTEKEAARWDEIESLGQPVLSAGQPDAGMTQPVIPEPSRRPEDTPTGQETPPEGVPPVSPDPQRPKTAAERRGLPATPPFPHPTDQPAPPPPSPEPPTPVEPARMPLGFEPPMPDEIDQPQPPARPEQQNRPALRAAAGRPAAGAHG